MYCLKYLLLLFTINVGLCQVPPFEETCERGTYPPKDRPSIPSYVVNLDLPPIDRWKEVAHAKSAEINNLLGKFKSFFLNFGLPAELILDLVDSGVTGSLVNTFPEPFGDEIKGIANATGLPLGEVVLYNIFYEVFTVCTSIIAQDTNGKNFHARNLDFGLFLGWNGKNNSWVISDALRPAIVNLDFQRNGKTVFKSVNFAGYIGILTGMKPGVFTLTMNERFNSDGGYIGIFKWIMGDRSGRWMGFLTRMVMENATSYNEAKFQLANTTMLAPAYFILGGNKSGEASVITRSREKAVDIWNMDPSQGQWFILETNYDHWQKPFFLDDRRTPATNCMKNLTQVNVGFPGIFDVLSSKPVLNKLTTYTVLMQVNAGTMETYIQYCPDPCWPW